MRSRTSSTLEHELRLVDEAIDAVGSGRFPSITVAGLRFGDELLDQARDRAMAHGLTVRPLFHTRRARRRPRRRARAADDDGDGPMKPAILIVEDDEALRSTLARHLRAHGYGVIEAESAEGALAALSRRTATGAADPRHQPAGRDGLVAAP